MPGIPSDPSRLSFWTGRDSMGSVYLGGMTRSTDFPVTAGAFITTAQGGGSDAYVAKLDPSGASLAYSTYLGGSGSSSDEFVNTLTLDTTGAAYVSGFTPSPNFPTTPGAYDTTHPGSTAWDMFVTKLTPDGSQLDFSTYVPNDGPYVGVYGIGLIDDDSPVIAGATGKASFPTTPGALQPTMNGLTDMFITRLTPDGAGLVFSTFYGGSYSEGCDELRTDAAGKIYISGVANSPNFPVTPGAYDTSFGGAQDVFVMVLDGAGSTVEYSTFVGGNDYEDSVGMVIDHHGRVHLHGSTNSPDFPTTPNCFDSNKDGDWDTYVFQLFRDGSGVGYSSYLGGTDSDVGLSAAIDESGALFVSGRTWSADLPVTPSAYDTIYTGPDSDAYVAKIELPWINHGHSLAGSGAVPRFSGDGTLAPASPVTLTLSDALPGAGALLIAGLSDVNLPLLGGTLVPWPHLVMAGAPISPGGELITNATWPPNVQSGAKVFLQYWIIDPSGPSGLTASRPPTPSRRRDPERCRISPSK